MVDARENGTEAVVGILRHRADLLAPAEPAHDGRVDALNDALLVALPRAHDDVARQKRPHRRIGVKSAPRERRDARTENHVRAELGASFSADLVGEGALHVQFVHHPEALLGEGVAHRLEGNIEGRRDLHPVRVLHGKLLFRGACSRVSTARDRARLRWQFHGRLTRRWPTGERAGLHYGAQRNEQLLGDFLDSCAHLPLLGIHLEAILEVGLEHFLESLGECRIGNLEVGFVVQRE